MKKNKWFLSAALGIAVIFLSLSYDNCSGTGAGSGSSSSSLSSSSGGSTSGGGATTPAGLQFYNSDVLPIFNAQCASCHNDPRFGGQGPLDIYTYQAMKNTLAVGPSSVNNNLINKMQNIIAHTGGNVCANGLLASPCQDVVTWWQKEFTTSSAGIVGAILSIDVLGNVSGWAQNINTPNTPITAYLYVGGGPTSGGTSVGSVLANGVGAGQASGHSFNFALPATYNNGKSQSLYVYGGAAADANLLPGAPQAFTAYTPTQAGMNYYTNTLQPLLMTKCGACHSIAYANQYPDLLTPPPSQGGTATTNLLVEKPGGVVAHDGGNVCGGINGSPCAQIQQWWNLEF